jgi:CBS domain-containing protein
MLCDGKDIANMNAFRIEKQYEGQGHISKLVKMAEKFAKEKGFKVLTIGSEAKESRNLGIYLHFGYTEFVTHFVEDDELVGMITSKDLMRAFIDFRKNVPEKYQKSQIKEVFVEDIMSTNPQYVSKEMSISEVSKIMIETGYNGLPVVDGGKVIGIITQTDILRLIEKLES